jgi:hypothetical protein
LKGYHLPHIMVHKFTKKKQHQIGFQSRYSAILLATQNFSIIVPVYLEEDNMNSIHRS